MLKIVDQKQFTSGLFFLFIGIVALKLLPADLGSASEMGPGYFPMLLGICLVLLGGVSVIQAIRTKQPVRMDRIPVVACLFIIAGVIAFSFLIRPFGLAVSLAALMGLGCYSRIFRQPLAVLAIYAAVLALTWFVFIYVIQLPITLGWR